MKVKVLHLGVASPIVSGFWRFLETHLNPQAHLMLISQPLSSFECRDPTRLKQASGWKYYLLLIYYAYQAEQLVIHGLFDFRLILVLFFQPWLLKKTYWIVWGADLYRYQIFTKTWKWHVKEFFRRIVIRNMAYLVTGTQGDFELAQQWYGAKGQHIRCFNYPSNLFKTTYVQPSQDRTLRLLMGNSADPANNHFEIFSLLAAHKEKDILIYCPLSYGDNQHAQHVVEQGKALFGEKFKPLLDFMPLEEYIALLNQVSIGIFAHDIQQAFGNKISLLGLGKKVYLKRSSTLWQVFEELDIKVFALNELKLCPLTDEIADHNRKQVQKYFSERSLTQSLSSWLLQVDPQVVH